MSSTIFLLLPYCPVKSRIKDSKKYSLCINLDSNILFIIAITAQCDLFLQKSIYNCINVVVNMDSNMIKA